MRNDHAAASLQGVNTVSEAVTEEMTDAGCDAFDEAVTNAKAERKRRNDEHEAAGRGRPCHETGSFPIDWLGPVYLVMRAAAPTAPMQDEDAELIEALANIARSMKYGPDQAWIEQAVGRLSRLSADHTGAS